jgi:hypothetical protein
MMMIMSAITSPRNLARASGGALKPQFPDKSSNQRNEDKRAEER